MNWNKIEFSGNYPHIPRDGSNFLAIWKGRICICQYDEEEGRFFICFDPGDYCSTMKVSQDRENKFSHWQPLPGAPID